MRYNCYWSDFVYNQFFGLYVNNQYVGVMATIFCSFCLYSLATANILHEKLKRILSQYTILHHAFGYMVITLAGDNDGVMLARRMLLLESESDVRILLVCYNSLELKYINSWHSNTGDVRSKGRPISDNNTDTGFPT